MTPLSIAFTIACLGSMELGEMAGVWQGNIDAPDAPITVELWIQGDPPEVRIGFPGYDTMGHPVPTHNVGSSSLQLEWGSKETLGQMTLAMPEEPRDGGIYIDGSRLAGEFQLGNFKAPVSLHHQLNLSPNTEAKKNWPHHVEPLTFENAGTKLAGELWLPEGPGPHPAVVNVHGSGDNERWFSYNDALMFNEVGVACLIFDKRGNGESQGHWQTVGFDVLAQDAIAGVNAIAARSDIDASRVGLYGISQAGWIMPLAATMSDAIRFLVVCVGAAVSVEQEGYYDYEWLLKEAGYGEDVIAQALELVKADNQVTRTGEGWDSFVALMKEARQQPWFKAMNFTPAPLSSEHRAWYRLVIDYDPKPVWEQVRVPCLLMYGAADESVHTPTTLKIMGSIQQAQPVDFTIKVFENASHGLRVPPEKNKEFPIRPLAPGVEETILGWLHNHDITKQPAPQETAAALP